MGNDKKESNSKTSKRAVPEAGTGLRNIDTWKRLAAVRATLSSDSAAREQLETNPSAYFQQLGLSELGDTAAGGQRSELEQQLTELATLDEVGTDKRQRIASAVVGPVAFAVAAGVVLAAGYNKVAAAQVGWMVNVGVNLNVAANYNKAAGFGTGSH